MKRLLARDVGALPGRHRSVLRQRRRAQRPPDPQHDQPPTTEAEPSDEEQLEELAEGWFEATDRIYMGRADLEIAAEYVIGEYLEGYEARSAS